MVVKFYHISGRKVNTYIFKMQHLIKIFGKRCVFHSLESDREPVLHFLLISDGRDKERKGVERRGGRSQKEWHNLFPRIVTSFMCFRSVRSCGLQNFRHESILYSFSGDILQCSLYLQMCETLCMVQSFTHSTNIY